MRLNYCLEVAAESPTERNELADKMIAACPVEHEASGVNERAALIRFRADSDEDAQSLAAGILAGLGRSRKVYSVHTGFGFHRRFLAQDEVF